MTINQFPDRIIQYQGTSYIYFGGTSYLGMATLPEFQKHIFDSMQHWGTAYGSSRNSNVKLEIYEDFERDFSKFVGAESALAVSSGTLAGKIVMDFLTKQKWDVYYYPNSHPAIMTVNSFPLFENNELHIGLKNQKEEDVVIVLDAVLSSRVSPTNLEFLKQISKAKRVTLVVDESHSLGIVGEGGCGIFNAIDSNLVHKKVLVASLAKAMGIAGGLIASDTQFIALLSQDTTFVSASGANPAYLDAYLKSKALYREQQLKLKKNLAFLFEDFQLSSAFKYHKDYPVIYCEYPDFSETLFRNKMVISNFKYPNYKGMLSRIVISAHHTTSDLSALKQVLLEMDQ